MQPMDGMNLGFLARQLILTELAGEVEDIAGGCLVQGVKLWAGLWEPAAIVDPEKFIHCVQDTARKAGTAFDGAVVLASGSPEQQAGLDQLAEALFVYGYPECEAAGTSGPEMVQVLSRPLAAPEIAGLTIDSVTGADDWVGQALSVKERLFGDWVDPASDWLQHVNLQLASLEGEPVGIAGVRASELASRVVLLWVAEGHRRQGIGLALLEHCQTQAAAAGRLLNCCWTFRGGKWRYYMNRRGFDEKLTARYFKSEE